MNVSKDRVSHVIHSIWINLNPEGLEGTELLTQIDSKL